MTLISIWKSFLIRPRFKSRVWVIGKTIINAWFVALTRNTPSKLFQQNNRYWNLDEKSSFPGDKIRVAVWTFEIIVNLSPEGCCATCFIFMWNRDFPGGKALNVFDWLKFSMLKPWRLKWTYKVWKWFLCQTMRVHISLYCCYYDVCYLFFIHELINTTTGWIQAGLSAISRHVGGRAWQLHPRGAAWNQTDHRAMRW